MKRVISHLGPQDVEETRHKREFIGKITVLGLKRWRGGWTRM